MNIQINGNQRLLLFGIGCVTLLEIIALLKGINGAQLRVVIVVIALAIGVVLPTPKLLK